MQQPFLESFNQAVAPYSTAEKAILRKECYSSIALSLQSVGLLATTISVPETLASS